MSRPFMGLFGSGDRAILAEELDESFAEILRIVNGNLDAGNVKRGTKFAIDATAGAVPYAWLEPNNLITLRGSAAGNGNVKVPLGVLPAISGIAPVSASAAVRGISLGTYCDVVKLYYGAATLFGQIFLSHQQQGLKFGDTADIVTFGTAKTFTAAPPTGTIIYAEFRQAFSGATYPPPGESIVTLGFQVPHQA